MKRCEGAFLRIDGTFEQCDNVAKHGSDYCWECRKLGNTKEGGMSIKKKSAVYIEPEKHWGEYALVGVAAEISVTFQRLRKFGLVRESGWRISGGKA